MSDKKEETKLWGPDKPVVHDVSMAESYALSFLEESPGMTQEQFDELLVDLKKIEAEGEDKDD